MDLDNKPKVNAKTFQEPQSKVVWGEPGMDIVLKIDFARPSACYRSRRSSPRMVSTNGYGSAVRGSASIEKSPLYPTSFEI
jgi:hypothetical protein